MGRDEPRAVGLHRSLTLLERVAECVGDRRVRHDLVLPDQVLEELDPAGRLIAADEARLVIGRDDVAAVLPDELGPVVLHVRGLGIEAPLLRLAVGALEGQLLRDLGQLRPVPGVVGVRDAGRIEHLLVVVEGDDVQVARQAELAVRRREVGHGLVRELAEVIAVLVDVRLEVEQDVTGLVVGEERSVHREDVRRIAAGDGGLELVPVRIPVRDRHLHGDLRRGRVERVDDGLLVLDLLGVAPDRVRDRRLGAGVAGVARDG